MAEIFVGEVAVGVVPDLRGFNDKLRAELVPSANTIGKEIGREISRGISDNLTVTKVSLDKLKRKITDGLNGIAVKIGIDVTKVSIEDVKRKIHEGLDGVKVNIKIDVTDVNLLEVRHKIEDSLKDIRAKVKLDVDSSPLSKLGVLGGLRSRIGGILPGGGGGSAGGGGAAGGGAAVAGGAGGAFLRGNQLQGLASAFAGAPLPAQIGVVATALAALPLIAQTAAGGIVTALGGAFLGVGIYAAAQTKQVQAAWKTFTDNGKKQVQELGQTFAPFVVNIISNLDKLASKMTSVFNGVLKVIGPPFQAFADAIINGLGSPHVVTAMQSIGNAFGKLLQAFTPDIPGIINSMADAMTRVANAVAKNPKAFADFINFLFQVVIAVVDAIAYLTDFANYVEFHFTPAMHRIAVVFDGVRHDIAHIWDQIFENSVGVMIRLTHNIETQFNSMRHEVAVIFDGMRHDINHTMDLIYGDTIGVVIRISHNVETQFNSMRHSIANIYDGIRHDISHIWDIIYSETVGATIRIWQITDSPFAHERHDLANIFDGIRHDMSHYWDLIYQDTIGRVIRLGHDVEAQFNNLRHQVSSISSGMRHDVAGIYDGMRHDASHYWDLIFSDTVGRVIRLTHNVEALLNTSRHNIAGIYDGMRHDISGIWDRIWNDTVSRALSGIRTLEGYLSGFRSWLNGYFSGAVNWLVNVGRNIVTGLLNGIRSGMAGIGGWIKGNVYSPIIGAVKHYFGIASPAASMVPLGASLIQGMMKGIFNESGKLGGFIKLAFGGWPQALAAAVAKGFIDISKLPAKAISALGGVAGKLGGAIGGFFSRLFSGGGSGVARWAGTVAQALAMLHLPQSLSSQVLHQISTESGGNPNAINLTDINAQMGDPSRGLLQTIGSTFAAFHVAGTSSNIYDPLANIAAAINYALHTYGPSLMSGGMGLGSGHGYDTGGWLPPGVTMAYNGTGQSELVLTQAQLRSASKQGSDGATYIAHFDSLTGAAIESHVRTAYTAMALTQGKLQRQGRRS